MPMPSKTDSFQNKPSLLARLETAKVIAEKQKATELGLEKTIYPSKKDRDI